ncbi:hypothetical protein MOA67_gp271 [Klebsiella phage KpLz-2_45]|uniref:hypothetical protein n=1 Tax=Klebsiella phage KpLz-2_45 TaxID=2698923 RepID=UPI001F12C23B|nr:hypothetical protein MOA67_gp271 [Klebsiella phage KpLz-2_45]UKS72152.1 hypothetical protein KpLz245_2860 [Klebsiella phage KpLz-2_45]
MKNFTDDDFFAAMSEIGIHLDNEQKNRVLEGEENEKDYFDGHRSTVHCYDRPSCAE